ncbi:MAG: glycosyltransferase family 39 protein [Acidobacteria bacterium]|nr:glycosyltransferase family 39 protein [Acidobacteriota bacterium]
MVLASAILAVALTYPMAFQLGSVGRTDSGDGQLSIWNVAWVARTLAVNPRHVFDANIFYPNRNTLAYSENNLGAGILAMPVYWITRNPYAAHNSAVLFGLMLSAIGMYYLVRYLTQDRRAAAISAVCFAFCPYIFAHMPHIQLLMIAGLPFSMLAVHRVIDRPTAGRGGALGLAMAAQALSCGYYGVFVILMVGFSLIAFGALRGRWRDRGYWIAVVVAAAVAIAVVLPAFLPYVTLHRVSGFGRGLEEARTYSANWSDYLASNAYAHDWMLNHLPPWFEVSFSGFLVLVFSAAGVWFARRDHLGSIALLYGALTLLAFWASFGPVAGLYSVLYRSVPLFAWLRAPARFGLIVVFGLSVLSGIGLAAVLRRRRRPAALAAGLFLAAVVEHAGPSSLRDVPDVEPVYRTLATMPSGPVIEMPFWYLEHMFPRHTYYMLQSTTHWMPLINGYSDYIPPDFISTVDRAKFFPSRDAFRLLAPNHVRYAVFHMYWYNDQNRADVVARLQQFAPYLRPLYVDGDTRLYEILGTPP